MDWFVNCQHVPGRPWRTNYRSSGLGLREVILYFGQWLLKEGLPLGDSRDVGFHLGSPVNLAGGETQVEMMVSSIWEGHQAITDAVVEKRTKARGPGCPQGTMKIHWTPVAAYNIKEWVWGLEEDASEAEAKMVMWVVMRLSRRMLALSVWVEVEDSVENKVPNDYQETLLEDLPLQEEGVQIREVSRVPISQPWLEGPERVTKQEGQEGVWEWRSICWSSIFSCLGWDDQHLLPYIFWSLQGFPGDLARSC